MTPPAVAAAPAPRVILAHDYVNELGGAERVLATLLERYPDAPLLTSAVRSGLLDDAIGGREVRTTFLRSAVADKRRARLVFPLLPVAFRRLRVPESELLLTSSSGFAHQLRPPAGTAHVWYCHTPPRFLWDTSAYFRGEPWLGRALAPALAALRHLDRLAASRVDLIVANSRGTAARVQEVYGRAAAVLPPPVAVDRFRPTGERTGRFLVLSRLLGYKRIDVAIAAAARTGLPLDVVGDGPERRRLEAIGAPTVRFHGRLPDEDARSLLARCTALLVPGEEDFGLTVVEAQASGRPTIAVAAGGALETIEPEVSGVLVPRGDDAADADAFAREMRNLATDVDRFSAADLVASARRFDTPVFLERLDELLLTASHARGPAGVVEPSAAGT
jgi:glycosyltransferase involved in cell wall biosynthesis